MGGDDTDLDEIQEELEAVEDKLTTLLNMEEEEERSDG